MLEKKLVSVSEIGRFTKALDNLERQCNYSIDIFANRRWSSYALMLCEDIIQWLDVEIFNSAIAMMAIRFSFFGKNFNSKLFVRKFFLRLTGFCQSFADIWTHSGHTKGMHRNLYGTYTKVNRKFSNRRAMHSVQIPRMHSECTPCMKGTWNAQPFMHRGTHTEPIPTLPQNFNNYNENFVISCRSFV
jgi:hypothetical protein